VVFIVIEVIVFGVFLYLYHRLPDTGVDDTQYKWSFGRLAQKGKDGRIAPNRRRSAEGVSGHERLKIHDRRPSAEALKISGKNDYMGGPKIHEQTVLNKE
jgi:hypothetical protein